MNNTKTDKKCISDVVDRQVQAYNKRDIDAFADTYHEDVELFIFPNDKFCHGKEDLRRQFSKRFAERPKAHATIAARIILEPYVVDDEILSGVPTIGTLRLLAQYEVKGGLITKVWFTYETPTEN